MLFGVAAHDHKIINCSLMVYVKLSSDAMTKDYTAVRLFCVFYSSHAMAKDLSSQPVLFIYESIYLGM